MSTAVSLRPITKENLSACLKLNVAPDQEGYVATNAKSLAEAYTDSNLYPLAIYDVAERGWEEPRGPMVGFCMYQLDASVGFILRLMVDAQHQGKGYGKAAMLEVIRRLQLHPEVELIGTSHRRTNETAANLYASLGFVPWEIDWAKDITEETYLVLPAHHRAS